MMHDRPSDPEYCQGIFDAAQRVVEHYELNEDHGDTQYFIETHKLITNLKRALEGKP